LILGGSKSEEYESPSTHRPQSFVKADQQSNFTSVTSKELHNSTVKPLKSTTSGTHKSVSLTTPISGNDKTRKLGKPLGMTAPNQRRNPFAEEEDDASEDEATKVY
jgi:hypothetical protein